MKIDRYIKDGHNQDPPYRKKKTKLNGIKKTKIKMSYIFQLYFGGRFYFWRTPEYPEKPTHLPQVYRNQLHCAISRHGNFFDLKTN